MGYIYKITSPTGRVYVGLTRDVKKRIANHKKCNNKSLIRKSIRKHGWYNHKFEVIWQQECDNQELQDKEIYYIDKFKSYHHENKMGLNLLRGGAGGYDKYVHVKTNKGLKLTQAQKDHLREINSYGRNPRCKIMFDINTGIYYDSIRYAAEAKGVNENTLRMVLYNFGNENRYGIIYTDDKVREVKERKPVGTGMAKICVDISTGIYFNSIVEASRAYNMSEKTLSTQLIGKYNNRTNLRFA